jgi:3',5'-cyclic AMP phosphodiesterase CpdA
VIMIKKFRWFGYVRWLSLFIALALLFIGLLLGEGHHPLYGPALQKRGSETPSDSFRFAFLSDLHKGWGVFKPIMKEIARDGYSFAIIGGDIVPESNEDRYRFFFEKLAEVRGKPPIYFVPGNHDVFNDKDSYSLKNFWQYCGPDHYCFSWENAAFVVLNDAQLTIQEDQFRWLESTLRQLRGAFSHIFVVMHVPPLDPREGKGYCLPAPIGKRFMQLMERFRVDCVFSGHIHCYSREVINGVTYIGSPPAGGTPRCANSLYYGYIQVVVQGQGLKDSVVKVEDDWWLQLKGNIQYELRVRMPFFLPLTVVMGQPFFYFFAF